MKPVEEYEAPRPALYNEWDQSCIGQRLKICHWYKTLSNKETRQYISVNSTAA